MGVRQNGTTKAERAIRFTVLAIGFNDEVESRELAKMYGFKITYIMTKVPIIPNGDKIAIILPIRK